MEKLRGKDFPSAVINEVIDNMAMEEIQQVQEL